MENWEGVDGSGWDWIGLDMESRGVGRLEEDFGHDGVLVVLSAGFEKKAGDCCCCL